MNQSRSDKESSTAEEEKGDVREKQDESHVSRVFQGIFPIGGKSRQDALKKMQVKAMKIKEKQEQHEREKESRPDPSPEFQKAKKMKRAEQSTDHKQLSTGDVRNRTVELLKAAIESCHLPEATSILEIVRALEQSIFRLYSNVGHTYKNKVRTIIWNLKENLELRTDLLTGVITPKKLATMSTEEMARSEVRKMREEAARQGLVERIGSSPICGRQPTWQYLTDRQLDKVEDL